MKRSPKLKQQILTKLITLDYETPAGVYLGSANAMRLNRGRIDRVAKRIVTGLHWHHFGRVPAADVQFTVGMAPDPKRPGVVEQIATDLLNGGGFQGNSIAGGVFKYAYAQVPTAPDWQAWLLLFYSTALVAVNLTKEGEPTEQP